MKTIFESYIKSRYGKEYLITEQSIDNQLFDYNINSRSNIKTIELKEREFTTEYDVPYKKNDILLELVQTVSTFRHQKPQQLKNIEDFYNPYEVITSIGWFFKTRCDRLIYIKNLRNHKSQIVNCTIYDIDWIDFYPWVLDNRRDFKELQYSGKTTGTINLVVKEKDIPKHMINIVKYKNN